MNKKKLNKNVIIGRWYNINKKIKKKIKKKKKKKKKFFFFTFKKSLSKKKEKASAAMPVVATYLYFGDMLQDE